MKTKQEWLFQLRKCTSRDTLEKVIEINRYKLPLTESEAFYSAADHRRAEQHGQQIPTALSGIGKLFHKAHLRINMKVIRNLTGIITVNHIISYSDRKINHNF